MNPIHRAKRFLTALAGLALVAAACANSSIAVTTTTHPDDPGPPVSSLVTDPAPTRRFVTFGGETVSLASYVGRPVVLNFWASWCPSCVAEMSSAFRPVQSDMGAQVTFIGMNIQDDRASAIELLQETGVNWISAEDQAGELYSDLGGIAMPFTVFIDAAGGIVAKHNGPLTESQLRDAIQSVFP